MFSPRRTTVLTVLLALLGPTGLPASAEQDETTETVLIQTTDSGDSLATTITDLGGTIIQEYQYIDVVAAEIPLSALGDLGALVGEGGTVTKDPTVHLPDTVFPFSGRSIVPDAATDLPENIPLRKITTIGNSRKIRDFALNNESAYQMNHSKTGVQALHADRITGEGVVVAIIDSGIRPGFDQLAKGTVLGCEYILNPPRNPRRGARIDRTCLANSNFGHGTFVAGLIAGNAVASFNKNSFFLNSVATHAPDAVIGKDDTVAMIGAAPNAQIYAFRVFGSSLVGNSFDVLAAVDRIIQLKEEEGVNIGVVNMSLGRRTLFAGSSDFDLFVDVLIDHDILPVIAVGNSGNSSMTIASPASSFESLSSGAASVTHQERIAADLIFNTFGVGIGSFVRPFEGTQTASFSSRGPNADGRIDPDVIVDGFGLFGQGLANGVKSASVANGTSFSTPLLAGIAALLRGAVPDATARQVRNAIMSSANPGVIDNSTELDQGAGYVNAPAALALLERRLGSDLPAGPDNPSERVWQNVERKTNLEVVESFSSSVEDLTPGERFDILLDIPANTRDVSISLSNIDADLPFATSLEECGPESQNCFFGGDTIMLGVHSAKTSSIQTATSAGDYFDLNASPSATAAFLGEGPGAEFVIADRDSDTIYDPSALVIYDDLEPGLLRVTVSGDVVNSGSMSAFVTVESSTLTRSGDSTASGQVTSSAPATDLIPITIPAGIEVAEFCLSWEGDWTHYPTNDLDLFVFDADSNQVLVDPNGDPVGNQPIVPQGLTLDAPEVVRVKNPLPGVWYVGILGFELNTELRRGRTGDNWVLQVTADVQVLETVGLSQTENE